MDISLAIIEKSVSQLKKSLDLDIAALLLLPC